jgi:hypothetical protein
MAVVETRRKPTFRWLLDLPVLLPLGGRVNLIQPGRHLYLSRLKAWLQGSKVVKGPQADVDAVAAE